MNSPGSPDDPPPNLRGPSLMAMIGTAVSGLFLGGLPLACIETTLEQWGRHVGPAYKGAYLPMGIFGAWLALRFLKRRR
jgi:hypothetical protein